MVIGKGNPERALSPKEAWSIVRDGIPRTFYEGKRVLVLTPDKTRTCPLPMMVSIVREAIGKSSARLDFMVALGTHPPMSEQGIRRLYGMDQDPRGMGQTSLYHHEWDRPETFRNIGSLGADEVERLSGGRLSEEVPISVNKRIFDYDLVLVMGPVFPHEVVGFSGGAKYFFPGISGGEFLHFFHWLGAVITCMEIIGVKDTPVRRLIHRAMQDIAVPVQCLAMVVDMDSRLKGLYAGAVEEAWGAAADLSSIIHVKTMKRPFHVVLGSAPSMYDEIWTAGKVMYKLEQVVADGGKLIIYAPHVREISRTWGSVIEKIGYHTRDYFLTRMDQYRDIPRGVLAHSTHVRGTGILAGDGEKPRIEVILATAIPEHKCRQINLGYMNPDEIHLPDYIGREDEGILFVDHAGETLYRLERSAR